MKKRNMILVILLAISCYVDTSASHASSYIDLSYMAILSGPSLDPSWNTPILLGESQVPMNMRNQIKVGYRINQFWSVGPVIDFILAASSQITQLNNPAMAVTKYDFLKSERTSVTLDFRLYFSKSNLRPSGVQSFQTTTYHLSDQLLTLTFYSFIHYEFDEAALLASGFPVLSYHLNRSIHPSVFLKATAQLTSTSKILEFIAGPGLVFTPNENLTLSVGLAITPTMDCTPKTGGFFNIV